MNIVQRLPYWLIGCTLLCNCALAEPLISTRTQDTSGNPTLELQARIVRQIYCYGDENLFVVSFDFLVSYKNADTSPVMLLTSSVQEASSSLAVAKTIDDLNANRYEYVYGGDNFVDAPPERVMRLDVDEVYQDRISGFAMFKRGLALLAWVINPGTHYVELMTGIKVRMLKPESDFVWSRLKSNPLKIDVPSNPRLQNCTRETFEVH